MTARVPGVEDRSLLPRWRTFSRSTAELGSAKFLQREPLGFRSLDAASAEFDEHPGWFTAGDLLAQATVSGQENDSVDRARALLLGTEDNWLDPARRTASVEPQEEPETFDDEEEHWRARARNDRLILRREPRNPIRWTDLALAHINLGNQSEAEAAMRVAVSLAPSNRYVLRSMARLSTVCGDPAEARRRLARSGAMDDPWLLAADLSLSDSMGVAPRNVRRAKALALSESLPAEHLTELRGALAKIELDSGASKRATELTRLSLRGATENSLAQAEWARQNGVRLRADETAIHLPGSFEASSRSLVHAGDFEGALRKAQCWLRDQPFAPEPATFISWLAVAAVDRPDVAVTAARRGLVSKPDDWTLRNNLAVALALTGETSAAVVEFSKINSADVDAKHQGIYDATKGMLAFRVGEVETGRELYRTAVAKFERANDPDLAAIASLFWAREEAGSRTAYASEALAAAERRSSKSGDLVVNRFRLLVAEKSLKP